MKTRSMYLDRQICFFPDDKLTQQKLKFQDYVFMLRDRNVFYFIHREKYDYLNGESHPRWRVVVPESEIKKYVKRFGSRRITPTNELFQARIPK